MKAGKILSVVLAAACCLLVLFFSAQDIHCSKDTKKKEEKTQYYSAAKSLVENTAISQLPVEINFSFSARHDFEIIQYALRVICQRAVHLYHVEPEYFRYSIDYLIHHYKISLIFPFHHFW